VLSAGLSSPLIAQWTVSRAVFLYIAALEVNVLNGRSGCDGVLPQSPWTG
jgi:hypothetical protein